MIGDKRLGAVSLNLLPGCEERTVIKKQGRCITTATS